MICRARPKYLTEAHFKNVSEESQVNTGLYFHSGRSALGFFLSQLQQTSDQTLRVAIQSFNCDSVAEAALRAGCDIILLDIKKEDFSISLQDLQAIDPRPDVLLLTHYQGMPNNEYRNIAGFCEQHDITLIDDLAQCEGSMIGEVPLGSLSDVQLRSYAFDKPFTAWKGGSLTFSPGFPDSFLLSLKQAYDQLPMESRKKAQNDLKKLHLLHESTQERHYENRQATLPLLDFLMTHPLVKWWPRSLWYHPFLVRVLYKLQRVFTHSTEEEEYAAVRLHPLKQSLVRQQRTNYHYNEKTIQDLKRWLAQEGVKIREEKATVHWNRYALLDDTGHISSVLRSKGIECGNFNWPQTLHRQYADDPRVTVQGTLPNSEYCSRHMVNIPVWKNVFSPLPFNVTAPQ